MSWWLFYLEHCALAMNSSVFSLARSWPCWYGKFSIPNQLQPHIPTFNQAPPLNAISTFTSSSDGWLFSYKANTSMSLSSMCRFWTPCFIFLPTDKRFGRQAMPSTRLSVSWRMLQVETWVLKRYMNLHLPFGSWPLIRKSQRIWTKSVRSFLH